MRLERISRIVLGAILLMLALQLPVTGSNAPTAPYHGTIKIGGSGGAYGAIALVADAFKKDTLISVLNSLQVSVAPVESRRFYPGP
jgi:hypothetical protein